jgi:predicted lipoprotein with Yx(FWY)xxD motif
LGAATTAPTTRPATAAPASVAAASTAANGPTVSTSSAGYFVGPTGLTLYTFDKDTAGKSNCGPGQCATNWPALVLPSGGSISVGTGLTASDFATVARDDGTTQVAFRNIPLYYFAGDQNPGDKNGDGVGGIWHLATTASQLPSSSSAPSAAASAAASGPAGSAAMCTDAKYQLVPCPSGAAASPAAMDVSVSTAGYLVGPNGMTLYPFDKDTTPNASSCTGQCLVNWPALTIAAGATPTIGTGLDQEDFTTFTRTDASANQVAYYGKPLYFFAADTAPGQTNGDGVGNIWHLAKPQ